MPGSIRWFEAITEDDLSIVGTKGEILGKIRRAGLPVPPGFIITSSAYLTVLRTNNLTKKIDDLLSTASYDHADSLRQVSIHIKKVITEAKLSPEFVSEIYHAYTKLSSFFKNASVTLMLSPTSTQTREQNILPQSVEGETNLLLTIRKLWTMQFTPAALLFRHQHKLDHFHTDPAILVQKNMQPEISGIVARGEIIIKEATKKVAIDEKQREKLMELAKRLETLFASPQTVVWAIAKGKLFILDALPVMPVKKTVTSDQHILAIGEPLSPGIATGLLQALDYQKDIKKITADTVLISNGVQPALLQTLFKSQKPAAIIFVVHSPIALSRKNQISQLLKQQGIPAIVTQQTPNHDLQRSGRMITVNGTTGEAYNSQAHTKGMLKTATKIFLSITHSDQIGTHYSDGVYFLGAETIIKKLNLHPEYMLVSGQKELFLKELSKQLEFICNLVLPYPVIYKLADLQTDAYRVLQDDQQREHRESNPFIGYHGATRALNDPLTVLELAVINEIRQKKIQNNLALLLPFTRTVTELREMKELMRKHGLHRSPTFKLWLSIETPAQIVSLEKFIEAGIDGVQINLKRLTTLLLGVDQENHAVSHLFNEQDPAMLWAIEQVIKKAQQHHIPSSLIYPSPFPHHSFFEKIVGWGLSSVSVLPTSAESMRKTISEVEKKLLLN